MFEVIKNRINNTDFDLKVIVKKIDVFYAEDRLSDDERSELLSLARSKAKPENSYSLQKQIDNLEERVRVLENKDSAIQEPTGSAEEYPEYVQPGGASDHYTTGDKITYNGKKYICKLAICVWTPDEYPAGWEEVIENTEDNAEV